MDFDEAVSFFGVTQTRLAQALGVTQGYVSQWGKVIPPQYQYQIEVLSRGRLKADRELRTPRVA